MIQFAAKKNGEPAAGIGLSKVNCEVLLAGGMIELDLSLLGDLPKLHLMLFAGEDEAQMQDRLRKVGILQDRPLELPKDVQLPKLSGVVPKDIRSDVATWEAEGGKASE